MLEEDYMGGFYFAWTSCSKGNAAIQSAGVITLRHTWAIVTDMGQKVEKMIALCVWLCLSVPESWEVGEMGFQKDWILHIPPNISK